MTPERIPVKAPESRGNPEMLKLIPDECRALSGNLVLPDGQPVTGLNLQQRRALGLILDKPGEKSAFSTELSEALEITRRSLGPFFTKLNRRLKNNGWEIKSVSPRGQEGCYSLKKAETPSSKLPRMAEFLPDNLRQQFRLDLARTILSHLALGSLPTLNKDLLVILENLLPIFESEKPRLTIAEIREKEAERLKRFVIGLFIGVLKESWQKNGRGSEREKFIIDKCEAIQKMGAKGREIDMGVVIRVVCQHFSVPIPPRYQGGSADETALFSGSPRREAKHHFGNMAYEA